MNSVALPVSASAPTLGAEGDLIRQAARGEATAFAELFRRHGQMAWRLAQAVGIDREASVAAVGNGFARSLRGVRRRQPDADGGFRPALLAAVYRCAMEDARAHAAGAAPATPVAATPQGAKRGQSAKSRAKRDDSVLVEAAFRSLPERWRAALWLSEVEALTTDRVAPILGVSEAVATQLVTRGTRGFAGRFAQARRPVPDHLGSALRQVALAMPANLGEVVAVRWKAVASDPTQRFAPVTAWLTERAARPLQVAVGGLLGMGLIGIGLVGQGSSVSTGPVAVTVPPNGTSTQVTQPGNFIPGSSPAGAQAAGGGLSSGFTTAASGAAAAGTSTAAGATTGSLSGTSGGAAAGGTTATATGPTSTPGSGSTTPPATGGGGGGGTGSGGGTGGGTGSGGGTGTGTGTPPVKTIVPLAPLATVTQSGTAITANVLPTTSGGSTASVTVGCSTGVGITVGTTTIGCKPAASATGTTPPATTPTTAPSLIGGLVGSVTKTLGGL